VTPRRTLALVALATFAVSCSPTTYDSSIRAGTLAPTTTVLPTGTAAQLLPMLLTDAGGLSTLINDSGDKIATVERIEALWAAVKDEVTAKDRDLATEITAEIAKGRAAATLNRPGAADKVYNSLKALVQAYLKSA
jgi:hypothetical protein